MAFTQAQYDALTEAIASGSQRVKYQDKEVFYRSLSDMLELQRKMAVELGIEKNKRHIFVVAYDKGL